MGRDSNPETLAEELFAELASPFTGEELFDCLTDLTFFIKNLQGEYVVVNQELVSRCGQRDKRELTGRRADEVFPPPLGQSYLAQDRSLLKTGVPILNQLELHIYHSGRIGWCLTNKLPLLGRQGRVIGLVGISKDLQAPNERGADYSPLAAVVRHIQTHYADPLQLAGLARRAGLSPYQLEQRIRKVFQITTGQFILKARMDAAVRRLRESKDAIAMIAQDCGYSDQSAFTRQFRRTVGLTPSEYRKSTGR